MGTPITKTKIRANSLLNHRGEDTLRYLNILASDGEAGRLTERSRDSIWTTPDWQTNENIARVHLLRFHLLAEYRHIQFIVPRADKLACRQEGREDNPDFYMNSHKARILALAKVAQRLGIT